MTNAVIMLARSFWNICLFRRGPQDLPASDPLMWATLAAYAAASLVILSFDFPPESAVPATFADALFIWASTALLLRFYRRPLRTRQTVTALAGCGLIISLVALPIIVWLTQGKANNADIGLPTMLWLMLFVWSVLVSARIFQQALSCSFILGLGITLLLVVADQMLINVFLPAQIG